MKTPEMEIVFLQSCGHRPATLLQKRFCLIYFPVNVSKFYSTAIRFVEHLQTAVFDYLLK